MEKHIPGLCEMEDIELLDLAIDHKDQKAWTELIKRYYTKVSATVYRIFGYDSEAEDIVQEVFMELAKCAGNFRRDSQFSTFLYRVSVNTAFRYIKRKTSKDIVCDSVELLVDSLALEKNGDCILEAGERAAMVNSVLKTLSPDKRMAIVLFEVENLTLKEISDLLKAPLQTVWSRIYNARKEMYDKIFGNMKKQR